MLCQSMNKKTNKDMRQPDINRIKRAMEHIQAAIVSINSIKYEHRTHNEEVFLECTKGRLADEYRDLRTFAQSKVNE